MSRYKDLQNQMKSDFNLHEGAIIDMFSGMMEVSKINTSIKKNTDNFKKSTKGMEKFEMIKEMNSFMTKQIQIINKSNIPPSVKSAFIDLFKETMEKHLANY